MNLLLIVFISTISLISNSKVKPSQDCLIQKTVASLSEESLTIECNFFKDKIIMSFKMKVQKKGAVVVKGDKFYGESKRYIKLLKPGNSIYLFDIKLKDVKEKVPNVLITIIE